MLLASVLIFLRIDPTKHFSKSCNLKCCLLLASVLFFLRIDPILNSHLFLLLQYIPELLEKGHLAAIFSLTNDLHHTLGF